MKNLLKSIVVMFVALISVTGCGHQTWAEVPVYYTPIYSIMPFDPTTGTGADEYTYDMYEYMVFYEVNELGVYNTYNFMNRYSTIEDFVDNSVEMSETDDEGNVTDSGLLYNFSFTEVIVSSSSSTDETTGESVTTETETRRYYTVIGTGVDWTRNYGTVTIKDEAGNTIRTYEDATVVVEQRWVDYDKKPN
ncbi:MAG: hypothetical protein SNH55_03955 [Rikenellaceae bacterium]